MAQQQRALRTKAAIVTAAAQVFGEIGYEAAAISDILSTAGVTKGALYFHFASKQELAQAVLDAQITAVPEPPEQPIRLQTLIDQGMLLTDALTHDPLVRGSVRLTIERARQDGPDRRGPYLRWAEVSRQMLEQAREQGELLPHVSIDQTAHLIVGSFAGVQGMSQVLSGYDDLAERISFMYQSLLPSVAVPVVLGKLDMRPDRAVRVRKMVEERTALDAAGKAFTESGKASP